MTKEAPKPGIGKSVHFYDPSLIGRIGRIRGYGDRGIGPYHAVVVNDLGAGLELQIFFPEQSVNTQLRAVPHKDDAKNDKPYWEWADPMAKARAAKAAAE